VFEGKRGVGDGDGDGVGVVHGSVAVLYYHCLDPEEISRIANSFITLSQRVKCDFLTDFHRKVQNHVIFTGKCTTHVIFTGKVRDLHSVIILYYLLSS